MAMPYFFNSDMSKISPKTVAVNSSDNLDVYPGFSSTATFSHEGAFESMACGILRVAMPEGTPLVISAMSLGTDSSTVSFYNPGSSGYAVAAGMLKITLAGF